jgi:hypothetical protein
MVKPVIVKRLTKGSHLTFTELDANFQNLDDATVSIAVSGSDTIVNNLNDTTTFVEQDGINITAIASSKTIQFDASLLQDSSPQLGGNLDVQTYKITTSVSNGNIEIDPPGSGKVIISGDLQVDGTTTTINSTTVDIDDKNITLAKGAVNAAAADGGGITLEGPTTSATLLYESDDDSWNFNKKTTATELQIDNINVNANTISSTNTNGSVTLTPNGTGDLVLDGLKWPQADGAANYVLKTNGSGQLSWTAQSGGGLSNVVEDTSPQLGGDLDINGFKIVSTDSDPIELNPDGTGAIVLSSDTVQLGDSDSTDKRMTSMGTGSLTLFVKNESTYPSISLAPDAGTNEGSILLNTNSDSTKGRVSLVTSKVKLGHENVNVGITTFGTGSLELTTNDGGASPKILLDDVNDDITITVGTGENIYLNGGIKTNTTTGTPSIYYIDSGYYTPDGYFETGTATASSYLKINVGGTDYYLELYS